MSRRRKIVERYPGKYYVRIQRGGQRKWIKLGSTLSTARENLRLLETDLIRGKLGLVDPKQNKPALFDSIALRYLNHSREIHSDQSHQSILKIIRSVWLPKFQGLYVHEITKEMLDDWVAKELQRVSARTVSNRLQKLKAMIYWSGHKIDFPRSPKVLDKEIIIPTDQELRQYLAHCAEWWLPIPMTMIYCGHRPVEIQNSFKSDVNLAKNYIAIRPSSSLKNVRGREIPIHDELRPILEKQLECQPRCRWLFPTRYGTRRSRLENEHRKTREKAGLPHLVLYHLRHAFCTRLLEAGVELATVVKLMGHSDHGITLRIYHHLRNIQAQNAISRLPGLQMTANN